VAVSPLPVTACCFCSLLLTPYTCPPSGSALTGEHFLTLEVLYRMVPQGEILPHRRLRPLLNLPNLGQLSSLA